MVSSSIKELTSSDDLNTTSIFPSSESIKASINKYTSASDINKSHALKRSSNNPLNTSVVTSFEEYDPENALYSHEHLNKKPKLENSSCISSISKNSGLTLTKSAAKERFNKSNEKSLTQSQYSKTTTSNLNNKVQKTIGSNHNKKRTLDFLES